MKKCASCTKDLPEAALHCVFCGAKQPPAPAVQPGLAKTAFGYSNEMLEHLKGQQSQAGSGPGPYQPSSNLPPVYQTPPAYQQPQQPQPPQPRPHSPSQQPYAGGLAPTAPANAATVFVTGGPPGANLSDQQQRAHSPSQQPINQAAFMQTAVSPPPPHAPMYPQPVPQPMAPAPMGMHSPQNQYAGPIPAANTTPYQQQRNTGRPVEPWKDSLPSLMIIWGIATLIAFATPISLSPLHFNWDLIIHGEGSQKIPMLIIAAVGLLGVVLGAIPMVPMPRGILALLLGASAFVVPIVMGGLTDWHYLAPIAGIALVIPGLLIRNEYTDSSLPRLMVTFGVIAILAPVVIPVNGTIPLVELVKAIINGHVKGELVVIIAPVVLAILSLLVWMPGPGTAGAKVFAWLWMLAPLVATVLGLLDAGHIVDIAKNSPSILVAWVPFTTCAVFFGYGLATVLGKQLE